MLRAGRTHREGPMGTGPSPPMGCDAECYGSSACFSFHRWGNWGTRWHRSTSAVQREARSSQADTAALRGSALGRQEGKEVWSDVTVPQCQPRCAFWSAAHPQAQQSFDKWVMLSSPSRHSSCRISHQETASLHQQQEDPTDLSQGKTAVSHTSREQGRGKRSLTFSL